MGGLGGRHCPGRTSASRCVGFCVVPATLPRGRTTQFTGSAGARAAATIVRRGWLAGGRHHLLPAGLRFLSEPLNGRQVTDARERSHNPAKRRRDARSGDCPRPGPLPTPHVTPRSDNHGSRDGGSTDTADDDDADDDCSRHRAGGGVRPRYGRRAHRDLRRHAQPIPGRDLPLSRAAADAQPGGRRRSLPGDADQGVPGLRPPRRRGQPPRLALQDRHEHLPQRAAAGRAASARSTTRWRSPRARIRRITRRASTPGSCCGRSRLSWTTCRRSSESP